MPEDRQDSVTLTSTVTGDRIVHADIVTGP